MKTMKLFLLMGVGLLSGTAALAQTDNKYLDDALLSPQRPQEDR